MEHCSQEGCKGHLGKFPTCLTEALWEWTLDGVGDSTGSVEAYGHYTLIEFDCATDYVIGLDLGVPVDDSGPTIIVPAGWYIVGTNDQGFVWADHYDTETEAKIVMEGHESDYWAWLGPDDPLDQEIAPNAGSSE